MISPFSVEFVVAGIVGSVTAYYPQQANPGSKAPGWAHDGQCRGSAGPIAIAYIMALACVHQWDRRCQGWDHHGSIFYGRLLRPMASRCPLHPQLSAINHAALAATLEVTLYGFAGNEGSSLKTGSAMPTKPGHGGPRLTGERRRGEYHPLLCVARASASDSHKYGIWYNECG